MKRLFLTSSVHAVAHDIAKKVDLSKGNKLVFIVTAADIEEGDKTWLKNDRQALKEDQVPLLLLTDNQYVRVQDDRIEIIDVTK